MKNYLTYINESIKYQFTIEQIQNKFQTFENNRYYGPVCAYLMDILKNNRVIIDVYRTTSKNCSLQQKYSIYVMDVIKPDNHNYTFIDENGYEYEPIYNRKISCYLDENEWIDEEFTSENKLYENFKPKYVNLNTIIADCKGDATLAEKNIKDLLLGETCIWYTKANVIKNMMVNSVEVNNVYQVYLNGHSVDKEMKVEIINLSKKDNDIYVVGFPSGEVIFLKKDQIEKLKNEKLIKYSNIVGVYGFMFYFNDTDYHKIKSYLDSNYKKPQKSQIIGLEPKLNYFIGDVIVCKGYSNMLDIDNKIATIRHKVKKSMGDSYSYLVEFNFKLHGDKGGSDGNFLWINIDNIKGIYKDIEKKIEDLEDHEIDDEYHIKNLFKKNDK